MNQKTNAIAWCSKHIILANLLLALAYFAIAYLTRLQSAVIPNFAYDFWPAAGIAVAAVLVIGYRMLPGVFLGQASQNFLINYDEVVAQYAGIWGEDKALYVHIGSVIIFGLATMTCALVARFLTARTGLLEAPLVRIKSIVLFCIFIGPIAAFFSSAPSTYTLHLIKGIPFKPCMHIFYTWMSGDAIGILFVTMLVYAFTRSPQSLWRPRRYNIALPLLCFLLVLMVLIASVRNLEYNKYVDNFEQETNTAAQLIQNDIHRSIRSIESIEQLLKTQPNISQASFASTVNPIITADSAIQRILWLPKIHKDDLASASNVFEEELKIKTDWQTTEDVVLPIYRSHVSAKQRHSSSFELGNNISLHEAFKPVLNKTQQANELTFSEPRNLSCTDSDFPCIIAALPIDDIQHSTLNAEEGLLIIIMNYDSIVTSAMAQIKGDSLLISDITSAQKPVMIFNQGLSDNAVSQIGPQANDTERSLFQGFFGDQQKHVATTFHVGSRVYAFDFMIPEVPDDSTHNWQSYLIAMTSMPIFLVFTIFLTSLSGRSHIIEQIVDQRTTELNKSKQQLETEVNERKKQEVIRETLIRNLAFKNEELEQFNYTLSHNLKSPLITMQNFLAEAMLALSNRSYEDIEKDIARIQRINHNMYNEIEDFINFSKAQKHLEKPIKLNVNKVLNETLASMQDSIDLSLISVDVSQITESSIQKEADYEVAYRVVWPDKSIHWLNESGSVVVTDGKKRLLGIIQDITQRKEMEEQLRHKALHDVLTNIPNRAVLMNHLNFSIDYAKRHNEYQYALLFIDLNQFKPINDNHGHIVGDKILIEVAQRLSNCLRPNDTVARLGGDEFALLLTGTTNPESAIIVAKRISEALAQAIQIDDNEFHISAAIGIVNGSKDLNDVESIINQADAAMYSAKHHGKAYEIYASPSKN